MEPNIRISVRNLVEFIMRSGDLDNTRGGRETEAMQEGSRLHRKIQRRMGSNYSAEVPLALTIPRERDGIRFEITLEGRADGIINNAIELPKKDEKQEKESQKGSEEELDKTQADPEKTQEDVTTDTMEESMGQTEDILAQPGLEHLMAGFIDESEPAIIIDESKCVYADLAFIKEMIPSHHAQAMCYS